MSACERRLSKLGDLSPSIDQGAAHGPRESLPGYCGRFSSMLDKLGVTGSSPVPPPLKVPLRGVFLCPKSPLTAGRQRQSGRFWIAFA